MSTEEHNNLHLSCVDCATGGCGTASGDYPSFCMTPNLTEEARADLISQYTASEDTAVMQAASKTSKRANAEYLCRVEETMDFARNMGYKKLGIAMCSGLQNEGRIFAKIVRIHGFEVYGCACKVGAVTKHELDCDDDTCCCLGSVSCNPLLQAELLNLEHTDLNVIIGLCVGHDSLFIKHSDAPCTVLIAKDRALGNNPAAALYAAKSASYYNRMFKDDPSLGPLP